MRPARQLRLWLSCTGMAGLCSVLRQMWEKLPSDHGKVANADEFRQVIKEHLDKVAHPLPFPASRPTRPSTPPDLPKPMTPPCSPSDAPYAANGLLASPPNPNALRSYLGDRARCDRPAPGLEQGTSALVRSLPPCDPPCRTTSAASRMRWSSWRASWSPPEATAAHFIRKAALCCCVRTVRRMRQVKHQSVL